MKLKQSREKLIWYFKTNKQINKQTKNRKKKREIGQCPNWIDVLSTLQEVRDTQKDVHCPWNLWLFNKFVV